MSARTLTNGTGCARCLEPLNIAITPVAPSLPTVATSKALEFVHGASVASQRRSIGYRRRCTATYMAILLISGARAQEAPWRVTRRWAGSCNQTYWGLREGFLRWAIACRWYPRVSMKIPITIMGNDSSCPMEIDPKKNPI
jgi:hypothetical protein